MIETHAVFHVLMTIIYRQVTGLIWDKIYLFFLKTFVWRYDRHTLA